MSSTKKYLVVVAGGKGLRMGGGLPKQFMPLKGLPVLMHTLQVFDKSVPELEIILVLPESQMDFWKNLCEEHDFTVVHKVTAGGATRYHSVASGLSLIQGDGLVAIHDAVRPLVSRDCIHRCFVTAEALGNAIPAIAVNDSMRELDDEGNNRSIDRGTLRIIQTPQVFQNTLIKQAFELPYRDSFTDDASVIEAAGHKVNLVEGNYENIKITRPSDIALANSFLTNS